MRRYQIASRLLKRLLIGNRLSSTFVRLQNLTPSYSHGTSSEPLIDRTVGEVLQQATERTPDKEILVFPTDNVRKTYQEFYKDARRMASGLLALGIKKGDRVGIFAPNVYEWTVAQFATAFAGLILVNINPAYRTNELEYCLRKVGIRCLISSLSYKTRSYYEMVSEICPMLPTSAPGHLQHHQRVPELKHVVFISDERQPGAWSFSDVLNAGDSESDRELALIQSKLQSDEPVNIQFTSGTTGYPKGATLSHHNIVNNAILIGRRLRYHETENIICCPPPLYHCFACVAGMLSAAFYGSTCVFPSPTFNVLATLKAVENEKCTALYGTPTMFIDMLNHKDFSQYKYDSLRIGVMAGSPCPVEVAKKLTETMHMTEFSNVYGTTENSPSTFQTTATDSFKNSIGTIGRVQPHTEAKIVNSEGHVVARNEKGELWTRGYCVMLGYWHDEEKTNETIGKDRWYRTGDLAIMDDEGYVKIVGRSKDMIIRGGENIYPLEIEQVLYKHPKIEEVQIVGVPDHRLGEAVCAWIRLRGGMECTAEEIEQFCKNEIAHFKVPRYIMFKKAEDFPVTVTGKIQKHKIREIAKRELNLSHPDEEKS